MNADPKPGPAPPDRPTPTQQSLLPDAGGASVLVPGIILAIVMAVVIAVFATGAVQAILTREAWYDDFYSYYVTRPDLGWGDAFAGHWLADNHPPLFYALARATTWLGSSIEARRSVNLIIGAMMLVGAAVAVRGTGRRGWMLALCYFASPALLSAAIPVAAELRSYFLSHCAAALMVLALVLVWESDGPPARALRVVLALSMFVAFNTHIITSLIAGSLVLPFVVAALLRRDRARVRAVLIPALFSGAFFVVTVAVQSSHWIANTANFWIPAGTAQAWGAVRMVVQFVIGGALPVAAVSIAGALLLAVQAVRTSRIAPDFSALVLMVLGIALATCLILALQTWRPSVIPKYLIALIPGMAMVLALGYRAAIARCGQLLAMVLVVMLGLSAIMAISRNVDAVHGMKGWDGAARVVGRQVAACPGAAVHTDVYWNRYLAGLLPADNAQVVAWSYRHLGTRHGFAVESPSSRRLGTGGCPTLFWAQIVTDPMPTAQQFIEHERGRGFALSSVRIYDVGGAWIASDRPLDLAR